MPHRLLDGARICAAIQTMCNVSMTQLMWQHGDLSRLIPSPSLGNMNAYGKTQSILFCSFRKQSDDVLLRTDGDGVPRLILGIKQVKIVEMIGHREKIFCADFL